MKIIVTHSSPDMDAITSVWLIKKYLPGWENAKVEFVPAGERLQRALKSPRQFGDSCNAKVNQSSSLARAKLPEIGSEDSLFKSSPHAETPRAPMLDPIEIIGGDEVIHVDTGLGPLDHHQISSDKICGASLTFDFVKRIQNSEFKIQNSESKKWHDKMEAVERMVKVVVDVDHFKEVFRKDPLADYHEFDLAAILDGLKLQMPGLDDYYVEFIIKCLDAVLHEFENRIWAEKEIKENGEKFVTRFGKGIGFETINDSVIKLAQKMGYVIVVRKDPRKDYVRIKALPGNFTRGPAARFPPVSARSSLSSSNELCAVGSPSTRVTPRSSTEAPRAENGKGIDRTLAYEKLKKMDPKATWFLHIGKKMLLNGSVKNPKMRPTKLELGDIIKVLEKI